MEKYVIFNMRSGEHNYTCMDYTTPCNMTSTIYRHKLEMNLNHILLLTVF